MRVISPTGSASITDFTMVAQDRLVETEGPSDPNNANFTMVIQDGSDWIPKRDFWMGDMSTGPLLPNGCTYTLDDYKQPGIWPVGEVVTINDDESIYTVDEILGQDILNRAQRGDFSWLLAQTLVANLNVNDYDVGYDIIRQAEELLCAYYVDPEDSKTWSFPENRTVKQMATYLANVLDIYFNNLYRCSDPPEVRIGGRRRQ